MSSLRPRQCLLEKSPGGYGFHLHGQKGRSGQFVRLVEPDTPASAAGLRAGDRLAFVNGETVEDESHAQVVARIRASTGTLELIVVDPETSELLRKLQLPCRKEFITEGIPVPDSESGDSRSSLGSDREKTGENGDTTPERLSLGSSTDTPEGGARLRPRLCLIQKGANGYGFNLHSDKSKPGQFIRAVDKDSPAERAGLRTRDKIVQVNGVSVVGMQHSEVVAAIKAGGDQTRLLVVDRKTEEFFKRRNIHPTEEHISGCLPEPSSSARESDNEEEVERAPDLVPDPTPDLEPASSLGLSLSLAQARERAHQKRAAKKAPPMDWSKRNELFSNL
ncbi:Na(+)/H(+) exchange regulatory cofactor NHE-RF1a [Aulostomus maculatus]